MLTSEGSALLAKALRPTLDRLMIEVGDGTISTEAPIIGTPALDGSTLTVIAEFGEDDANFEWRERRLLINEIVIDVQAGDWGRKAEGAVWTLEASIEMAST